MPQHDFWSLLQTEHQNWSEWKQRAPQSASDSTRCTWWLGLVKAAPTPSVGGGLSEAHVLLKVCAPGCCQGRLANMAESSILQQFLQWVFVNLPDHLPMLACLHAEAPACLVLSWCLPATHSWIRDVHLKTLEAILLCPPAFFSTRHLYSKESPSHARSSK